MTVPEVQKWLAQNPMMLETLTMGNNFRLRELARFFNTARFQGEPLNADEQRLYDWLLQMRLLHEEEAGVAVVEPGMMLISMPQASTVDGCAACTVSLAQRKVILEHEFSHARFAIDIVYQHYVMWFWSQRMSVVARSKFMQFLRVRGYETTNRELMANEMQAFLMHTADRAMFGAATLGMSETELSDLRLQFQAGLLPQPRVVSQVTRERTDLIPASP